jgi:hypothetical protein
LPAQRFLPLLFPDRLVALRFLTPLFHAAWRALLVRPVPMTVAPVAASAAALLIAFTRRLGRTRLRLGLRLRLCLRVRLLGLLRPLLALLLLRTALAALLAVAALLQPPLLLAVAVAAFLARAPAFAERSPARRA